MARGGVEPPTFRFSVGRSYQLSYLAVVVLVVLDIQVAAILGPEPVADRRDCRIIADPGDPPHIEARIGMGSREHRLSRA